MSTWELILKEIRLRKLSFTLGLFSLLVAVGVLTAQLTLLHAHDLKIDHLQQQRLAQTQAEEAGNQDAYRKIMLKLGLNLLILPRDQNLENFYADGFAAKDMPDDYVNKLAEAKLASLKNIMPSLEQKIRWPEEGERNIILIGTSGHAAHPEPQVAGREKGEGEGEEGKVAEGKGEEGHGEEGEGVAEGKGEEGHGEGGPAHEAESMAVPVAKGTAVVGYELADSLKLKRGSTITLMGQTFTVAKCNSERGTKDDVTIWISLEQAQTMLSKPGRINSILALQCICQRSSLEAIREDVGKILPGVQVLMIQDKVETRQAARSQADILAQQQYEAELQQRQQVQRESQEFASWLIPMVTFGSALWVGLLVLINVRERRTEIGLWRAVGFSSNRILFIFLGKSLLLGFLGAVGGCALGYLFGVSCSGMGLSAATAQNLFQPSVVLTAIIVTPLLAAAAALPPALWAARLDPAVALQED